jgi:hypothetical protein
METGDKSFDLPEGKIMNLILVVISGVVAGIFMPLLSKLPILNLGKCIPCGWIWIGGIVAVGIYRWLEDTGEPIFASDGAILGLFTGIVAAFTSLLLAILLHGNQPAPEPSARVVPILDQIRETFHFTTIEQTSYMFLFLFDLIFYPIISAISGLVGVRLFGKARSRAVAYRDPGSPIQIE